MVKVNEVSREVEKPAIKEYFVLDTFGQHAEDLACWLQFTHTLGYANSEPETSPGSQSLGDFFDEQPRCHQVVQPEWLNEAYPCGH